MRGHHRTADSTVLSNGRLIARPLVMRTSEQVAARLLERDSLTVASTAVDKKVRSMTLRLNSMRTATTRQVGAERLTTTSTLSERDRVSGRVLGASQAVEKGTGQDR